MAYVARPIGAVRLHGRNPLFVPCSAFVMRGAALALLEPDFLLPINAMRSLLAELDAPLC